MSGFLPAEILQSGTMYVRKEGVMAKKDRKGGGVGAGTPVYFFGFIGAAIYFIQNASGFWWGVLGFLKAIVWPVFVVYKILGL